MCAPHVLSLQQLKHDNIVGLIEVFRRKGKLHLVRMPSTEGPMLVQRRIHAGAAYCVCARSSLRCHCLPCVAAADERAFRVCVSVCVCAPRVAPPRVRRCLSTWSGPS